jgi:hypothetical protein
VWRWEQTRILDEANRERTLAGLEENSQVQTLRQRRTTPGTKPKKGRSGSWSKYQTAGE